MTAEKLTRGQVWWADLGEPRGSAPAYRRPVVVIQTNGFNRTNLATVTVVALTSRTELAAFPGNIRIAKGEAGLGKPSVINITQMTTIDREHLVELAGRLPAAILRKLDDSLRFALDL